MELQICNLWQLSSQKLDSIFEAPLYKYWQQPQQLQDFFLMTIQNSRSKNFIVDVLMKERYPKKRFKKPFSQISVLPFDFEETSTNKGSYSAKEPVETVKAFELYLVQSEEK